MRLKLASRSRVRAKLLREAGFLFETHPASIDETAVLAGASDRDWSAAARALATAKAAAIDDGDPGTIVLGADQVLEFEDEAFETPQSVDEAVVRLRRFAGREHQLHTSAAVRTAGALVWTTSVTTRVRMRSISDAQLRAYAERASDALTNTVGGYEIEGLGALLIERLDGDFFAALGLPLFDVVETLARLGVDPLSTAERNAVARDIEGENGG